MGRFLIYLGLCVIVLLVIHALRRQRVEHAKQKKRQGQAETRQAKSKGRLVHDPKTGDYHVVPDDKD